MIVVTGVTPLLKASDEARKQRYKFNSMGVRTTFRPMSPRAMGTAKATEWSGWYRPTKSDRERFTSRHSAGKLSRGVIREFRRLAIGG